MLVAVAVHLPCCSKPKTPQVDLDQQLFDASQRGDLGRARALLQQGANVNGKNEPGETPIFGAVIGNSSEMVLFLIQSGADVNARTHDGLSPYHMAGELAGSEKVAAMRSLLAKHGAVE
jgi:ankyrin repeat protein